MAEREALQMGINTIYWSPFISDHIIQKKKKKIKSLNVPFRKIKVSLGPNQASIQSENSRKIKKLDKITNFTTIG